MSDTCGDCDCADKSQCVKKGNENEVMVVGTEKSYVAEFIEFSAAGENDGNCKCGPNCTCTDCTCGH